MVKLSANQILSSMEAVREIRFHRTLYRVFQIEKN